MYALTCRLRQSVLYVSEEDSGHFLPSGKCRKTQYAQAGAWLLRSRGYVVATHARESKQLQQCFSKRRNGGNCLLARVHSTE